VQHPDLNLLIALDALLQEGNVSRAATRVGLSTPAMSHALARLRTQLGDPLLVRAGQRMVPTPRATDLKDRVHALAQEVRAVLAPPAPADLRSVQRAFRVRTTDQFLSILNPALDRRLRAAPGIAIHVMPVQREDAILLREGTIDLAIGVYDYSPYSDLPSDLRIQKLFEDHYVSVVRRDHPTVGRSLTLDQYAELEHIQVSVRGPPGGYVDELLAAQGRRRRIARAVPYFIAALELVAQTDYVLTLAVRYARKMAPRFDVRLVQPPRSLGLEPYQVSQIWHPRNDRDAAHRFLRDAVADAARKS
jgi:DNA-binding transcriptional LysR family regulator